MLKFLRLKATPEVLAMGTVLLVTLLSLSGLFNNIDTLLWDELQRSGIDRRHPHPDIVMAVVEQQGLDELAAAGVEWPWPRDIWARFLEIADSARPRAVLFDILFDQPGQERLNSNGRAADALFATALNSDTPVVLAALLVPSSGEAKLPLGMSWTGKEPITSFKSNHHRLLLPLPQFQSIPIGLTNVTAEPDGVIRRLPVLFDSPLGLFPSLAVNICQALSPESLIRPAVDHRGLIRLHYYGLGGPGEVFPYYSITDIILERIDSNILHNKIIIVGGYAPGLFDFHPTPFADREHPYPGCEIHATFLSNLLQRDSYQRPYSWVNSLIVIIMGLLVVLIFRLFKKLYLEIFGMIFLVVIFFIIIGIAFVNGILLDAFTPVLAANIGAATIVINNWHHEQNKRRQMREAFNCYLDTTVIEELLRNDGRIDLESRIQRMCILFTDIVGFSTHSERLPPDIMVEMLNDYYETLVDVMFKYRAFLDKYMGDAVVILFGVPTYNKTIPEQASRAILEAQQALYDLTLRRSAADLPTVDLCVGMHLCDALIGNLGHPKRKNYTVIGSGVNIASRLESANRQIGSLNLVSADIIELIPDEIRRREIGRLRLKGLNEGICSFELIPDSEVGVWLDEWDEVWNLWRDGSGSEAVDLLRSIIVPRFPDKVKIWLIRRFEDSLKEGNPGNDIFTFIEK